MADRFVQHDAGPAGAEHHVHLAGRRRQGVEVGQRLSHRPVDSVLPRIGDDEALVALAAAVAGAAGLLPVAVADHDRNVDAHQRADIAIGLAIAAHTSTACQVAPRLTETWRTRGSLARA